MKWTKDKPTKPGWYWMDFDGFKEPTHLFLQDDTGRLIHWWDVNEYWYADEQDARWAGPIPEPEDGGGA